MNGEFERQKPDDATVGRPVRESAEADRRRLGLRAECGDCFGLCCVATMFTMSAEFAINKPAGQPCTNLRDDFRCGIHTELRERGFSGCTVFDCLGAGQKVSQHTFVGIDWRQDPDAARRMFAVFAVVRQLHELLWNLTEALGFPAAQPLHEQLRAVLEETDELTRADAQTLDTDVPALRQRINVLVTRASELARAAARRDPRDRPGFDLIGANLAGSDLRGADLRGALLMDADVTGADLRLADVTGAATVNADLSGADLGECLF
jgi:uncharacterized protein YjbI with pentapeptide repeats